MDDDWEGHPLRKDYPIGGEPVRFSGEESDARPGTHGTGRPERPARAEIYEGSRIPAGSDDAPGRSRGPRDRGRPPGQLRANHPSMHGVLRLVVDLNGETSSGCGRWSATSIRASRRTWSRRRGGRRSRTRADRLRLLPEQRARLRPRDREAARPRDPAEGDLDADAPLRAQPHPFAPGVARDLALELGAISMFWYAFRERERILDLFELVGGTRMHTRYFQAGGLAEDIPPGFYPECRQVRRGDAVVRRAVRDAVDRNKIWLKRRSASVGSRPRTRSRSGGPGPCCARRRRLGPPARPAYLVTATSISTCPLHGRRRLRPLPGAHGGDA